MTRTLACLVLAAAVALGQEFEVVSVKPDNSGSNSSSSNSNQGRYTAENVNLRSLVMMAYGMLDYQMEAPEWMRSAHYDISAKFPEALPKDREKAHAALQAMMQKMLVDRFKLTTHREQRTIPVYGLVVGKSGIRVKEVPDAGSHGQSTNNNHYKGTCVDMAAFAAYVGRRLDQPVLDFTGLKGFYDLTLDWVPESRQAGDSKADAAADAGPTFRQAIQEQLGLKLEGRKAAVEFLIVDHAEKIPTEN